MTRHAIQETLLDGGVVKVFAPICFWKTNPLFALNVIFMIWLESTFLFLFGFAVVAHTGY